MLQFLNITFGYPGGVPVLTDFTLDVLPGHATWLSASNGTGKSTALKLAAGFLRPNAGQVTIDGVPAHNRSTWTQRSYMSDDPGLYDFLTVAEQVALTTGMWRMPSTSVWQLLDQLDVERHRDELCRVLSLGTRKKLWFALTTETPCPLILLDEPFNGMDDTARRTATQHLRNRLTDGAAILFTSHHTTDLSANKVSLGQSQRRCRPTPPS
jgi:ABC-2 type transport system ATP-binding protein